MLKFLLIVAFLFQTTHAFKLPGGTVTGVLRTNKGAPMASVRVAVVPADESDVGNVLQAIGQSDSEGRYRIENVPPGRYHIMTGRMDSPLFHPGVDDVRRGGLTRARMRREDGSFGNAVYPHASQRARRRCGDRTWPKN
jgi:hypothetical protein